MARFLRDIRLSNITVSEALLRSIHDFLATRCAIMNGAIDSLTISDDLKAVQKSRMSYVVRFDSRGNHMLDPNEALRCYQEATEVERVIITLDSIQSENSNRQHGVFFEIGFDKSNPNGCYIKATADDTDIVDAVYNGLLEIAERGKNKNGWFRNTWTTLIVQLMGVAIGFILSLITAIKIAPTLKGDNAFVLTFIFAFLVFSNTWGLLNQQLLRLLTFSFPNIRFARQGYDTHWLTQAIVGSIIFTIILYAFSALMTWVGAVLEKHITGG